MSIQGKKIAILATDGFEQSELFEPYNKLKEAEATVEIVSPKVGEIKAWDKDDWGKSISVDKKLSDVQSSDYDALVLPGGVMNPDTLRTNQDALDFVNGFMNEKKPVGAICHAPWILISADAVQGREMTSYKSIQDDLKNAGATWKDQAVVVDNGLVTSRNPGDLPQFIDKVIEEVKEGKH